MKTKRHLLWILLIVVLPASASAGDVGDSGALFLRTGMGARAAGMGEAFSAVAEDASAIYWNPGAMAAVLGTNLLFMHNEYFQSVRLEQAALTHETDWGTFGLSFTGLYMDEMDRYEDVPSSVPLGTFSAYDVSFSLAYARYLLPNLAAGISAKWIYENIDETTAKGYAFDAGLYYVSGIPGVKIAAVVANLGPPLKFENDHFSGAEFDLPAMARVGVSYEKKIPSIRGGMLVAFDMMFPNDGSSKQLIGGEYNYLGKLFLRAGYKAGYDSQGPTFGLGVAWRKFAFDYAVILVENDLGDSHRVGFVFSL